MNKKIYVKVAVALPMNTEYHYSVPTEMISDVEIGKRVWVMFRNKKVIGFIVAIDKNADVEKVNDIVSIIDGKPMLSKELLDLAREISKQYMCSFGEALAAFVPTPLKKGKTSVKARGQKPEARGQNSEEKPKVLTAEQSEALKNINASIESNENKVFLLYGITSSGKTEVYLQAIEKVLQKGRSAIILVPEISLTPQTVRRFTRRFCDEVAVMHSRLAGSKKYEQYDRIRSGQARVIVGARSAIFSPIKNLGLIVIDEEHETTYKQDDVPRYHARDVAIMRAEYNNCPVIIGTATPSLESYYLSKINKYKRLELLERIDKRALPEVKIIDMRQEIAIQKRLVMFSRSLVNALEKAIANKNQAMIFLNRRGFATYINCRKCGHVIKCDKCDAVMIYHFAKKKLICHYCGKEVFPPRECPACKSGYVKYFGVGTERVEAELSRLLPGAKIARMDKDSTTKKGSHENILKDFKEHRTDILVGTQMIAKGLDFPNVTMVGIVNADVTLNLPDFRAGERTFDLITQVAGRAGRGKDPGTVIVQTYVPEHYVLKCASKHDYKGFYEQEIVSRKEHNLPPYVHLGRIIVRSKDERTVEKVMLQLYDYIKEKIDKDNMLGPAPCPITRIGGYFRWNILVKEKTRSIMVEKLREALDGFRVPNTCFLAIDIDTMGM
ncbi:MAG: primosomal protein N' [Candidatus Omnitrophica bacterium]|nr:primosomal protein N' [Candidatus Omnitrophota bacterium]